MKELTNKVQTTQIKRLEFNPIKTIKLIIQDSLLRKVYNNTKCEPFDYDKLIESAMAGKLPAEETNTLKDIYESIVLMSEQHSDIYDNIPIETPVFNTIKTIKIINKDSLLQKAYTGKSDNGYHFVKLIEAAKANKLSSKQVEILKDIFESIILFTPEHIELYNDIKEVRRKTPTRYGKQQLQEDIAAQGGTPTTTQQTLLDLATLEKHKQTISYRCIQDHYKGSNKINDEQHQKIQDAIRTLNMTLKDIL